MGTPVPTPEPPYGTDCPACTPGLWPSGKTPENVYIYVTGIQDCGKSTNPPPNGKTFACPQMVGSPCIWYLDGSVWKVTFHAKRSGYNYSWVTVFDADGWSFFNGTGDPCPSDLHYIDNDQASCILQYAGAGGYAIVSYFDVVSWLVANFGLVAGSSLFNEIFEHPSGDVVQKFCDRVQRTNIKFRISS